jgi:hypothetical protein
VSEFSRNERRRRGPMSIKISGKMYDLFTARIVFKCELCLGDLELHNAGLRCKTNHEHRGFVHRDEVAKLKLQQEENINSLKEVYQIIDGKVVIKNGN